MLGGENIQLYDFFNEGPLLVDFWATWCAPCKKEMIHLDRFHRTYTDRGFNVLTINQDTPRSLSKVKSYVRSKKFTFQVEIEEQILHALKSDSLSVPLSVQDSLSVTPYTE